MLPGKLNNRTLWPKTPPGPHLCSQHLLHTVCVAPCLSPSSSARDRLRHPGKTQSWDRRRAVQSLLCFWHVCRCACTWLPLVRSEFLSVWCSVISKPLSVTTHVPPRVCLCGFQSLRVSPCVSPCLVCGFPSSPPTHKPVCLPPIGCVPCSEFPLGVWKCEYHQMS